MPAITDVANFIGTLAPWELAEDWDNVGTLVQCATATEKILVSLDITTEVVQEAEALGCGLVVAHHPVIFKPLHSIGVGSPVLALTSRNISAICAHTNLDAAQGGVSDVLAGVLGLQNVQPLGGPLRVGHLPAPMQPGQLAKLYASVLGSYVQLASAQKPITTVAVVGGSGADYWPQAQAAGADCLLTGEVSHHDALDATAAGFTLLAAGHHATEWPVTATLAGQLQAHFADAEVFISQRNPAPFKLYQA
ncbi:Nif3-like dinuclear metal center hexameric protein [Ruminococcaceae bacterium OttesenSCG-928-A16]|nr:Nif3-like dinuclear metal center hexameric protein [Ruminococcaceae bacterium OttesenSCG-928-A16]